MRAAAPGGRRRTRDMVVAILSACVAAAWLVVQWHAVHTENVNWDEFALLARASESLRSGRLLGAGRPGLASLILLPIVSDCTGAVEAVVRARELWLAITAMYLAGVFAIVCQALPDHRRRWPAAAMAVASLALVPVFLRWSLQVRSDQPALMFAAWGAALVLAASTGRLWLAVPAGIAFTLGYLSSQKAIYVAAIAIAVVAIRLAPDLVLRSFKWRRAALLLAGIGAGCVATLYAFDLVVSRYFIPPRTTTIAAGFDTFAYYRRVFGFRAYEAMAPTLWPHIVLVGMLFGALVVSGRREMRARADLVACWLVLLAGLGVGLFHAAAFPYFWMTLGLFPAVAIGLGVFALREVYGRSVVAIALVMCGAILAIGAAGTERRLADDSQRVQRDAEAFIGRNFDARAHGFQAEGGLFCRADSDRFPTYFAETVAHQFSGDGGKSRAEAFVGEFRTRPVTFIVVPRVTWFGPIVERFWADHYVLYRDEVMVPGRAIRGHGETEILFDVFAPGAYRWHASDGAQNVLAVDGVSLEPGHTIDLTVGVHTLAPRDPGTRGILAIALKDDPGAGGPLYYSPAAIRELDPLYPRFIRDDLAASSSRRPTLQ